MHRQRSLGLSGWAKIFGQGVVAVAFAIMALQLKDADGWSPASASISVVRDTNIDLMFWGPVVGLILFVIWIYFLVAATSNGVNIADGLDGLVYEGKREVRALAGEVYSFPVELSIAPEKLPSSANEIVFRVRALDDPSIENDADSRFIGPSVR